MKSRGNYEQCCFVGLSLIGYNLWWHLGGHCGKFLFLCRSLLERSSRSLTNLSIVRLLTKYIYIYVCVFIYTYIIQMHVREGLTTLFRFWSNLNHGFCWLSYHRNWNHFLHLCIKLFFFFGEKNYRKYLLVMAASLEYFACLSRKKKVWNFFIGTWMVNITCGNEIWILDINILKCEQVLGHQL